MRIYGLDFTSAPDSALSKAKKTKRLVLAGGKLAGQTLTIEYLRILNRPQKNDFGGFEAWLDNRSEPWIAGLDFPFSQPSSLVEKLSWPRAWAGYVAHIQQLGKQEFELQLKDFKASQPPGQKHLFRAIDKLTRSQSPMTLAGTPVGKMFFEGARRLLNAGIQVPPLRRDGDPTRTAIEVYPALVVRKILNPVRAYKQDDPGKANSQMENSREEIVKSLRGTGKDGKKFHAAYGLRLCLADEVTDSCINDFTGDSLDSVLCAAQAAWAYQRRDDNFGMPTSNKILEGWICDPETQQSP